jgi:VanZ family protein
LVVLVFFALGPAKWTPRSGLGFEFDHFVGYFFFTLLFCLAWPRPLAVGGALAVLAVVLENLQSFLPGRSSYFVAALYSAGGVVAAVLLAELFIRAQRWFQSRVDFHHWKIVLGRGFAIPPDSLIAAVSRS